MELTEREILHGALIDWVVSCTLAGAGTFIVVVMV